MMPAKSTSDHRTYSSMMYGLAGIASRTVEPEREARGRQTPTPAQQRALDARRRARPSVPVRPEPIGTQPAPQRGADRKSTRLNSSHSQISYAVFCLKKKKNRTGSRRARGLLRQRDALRSI